MWSFVSTYKSSLVQNTTQPLERGADSSTDTSDIRQEVSITNLQNPEGSSKRVRKNPKKKHQKIKCSREGLTKT